MAKIIEIDWYFDAQFNCMVKIKALTPRFFVAIFGRPNKRVVIVNLHGLQIVSRSWRLGVEIVMPWQPGGKVWTR